MATATFEFPNSIVKRSLSEIRGKCPDATPFDLLAALFWTRVVHLKGNQNHHKDNETQSLSVCVDVRRLLTEPLPYGHFGNALHFSVLSVNGQEMESGGLEHVAELVHRHVSGLQEDEFWSAIQWLESLKGEEGEYGPPFTMYGPELTCVNMEHMVVGDQSMIYSKNFNSIKPVHVACHVGNVEGEGLIMVMPNGGGRLARTVIVTLPENEMARLCQDEVISGLEPTMLFSGRL